MDKNFIFVSFLSVYVNLRQKTWRPRISYPSEQNVLDLMSLYREIKCLKYQELYVLLGDTAKYSEQFNNIETWLSHYRVDFVNVLLRDFLPNCLKTVRFVWSLDNLRYMFIKPKFYSIENRCQSRIQHKEELDNPKNTQKKWLQCSTGQYCSKM